jgi:hypothetical protein
VLYAWGVMYFNGQFGMVYVSSKVERHECCDVREMKRWMNKGKRGRDGGAVGAHNRCLGKRPVARTKSSTGLCSAFLESSSLSVSLAVPRWARGGSGGGAHLVKMLHCGRLKWLYMRATVEDGVGSSKSPRRWKRGEADHSASQRCWNSSTRSVDGGGFADGEGAVEGCDACGERRGGTSGLLLRERVDGFVPCDADVRLGPSGCGL